MSSRVTRSRTDRIYFLQNMTIGYLRRGDRPWDTNLIRRFTADRGAGPMDPSIPYQWKVWFNRYFFDVIIRIRISVRNWIRRRRERLYPQIAMGWPAAWNVVEINPNAPVLGQRAVAGVGAIRRTIPVRTRWQPYRRASRREWGRY